MKHDLWVEEYRPKTLDDYVWRDENQKQQIVKMVEKGNLPHLLFSGSPGIGKTTLAKVLLNELGVNPEDIKELNGSTENRIDVIRENITQFVSYGFGNIRYVLYDEADYLTQASQAGLRNLMEQYSKSARFILTANYPHKIIPAVKSRCQHFHFNQLDRGEFIVRAATILATEGIEFEIETLESFVEATYPDLRKCINLLQQYSVDGNLLPFEQDDAGQPDWYAPVIELFETGKINEARKVIIENIQPEEYETMFRFFYENLHFWGDEEKQMEAILVIREGLVNHALVADPEINLSATLVKLSMINK